MSSLQRFSGMSLTSQTTYGIEEEPNYEDMTDDELKARFVFLNYSNEILALENDVFECYLHRNDSQSLVPMAQVLETAKFITSQMTQISLPHFRGSDSISGFSMREKNTPLSPTSVGSFQTFTGSRAAQLSTVQSSTRGLRITLSQRIEMTNKEIEEVRKEFGERESLISRKKANFHAQLEEIQMRIRDTNEARDQLEENVVKKGVDSSTGKILAEKFVRYIDMWLKNANRIIDKLGLKSSTVKTQMRKARIQLRQREELGASLHLVDFQALAIENKDYSTQIEKKTHQMMELNQNTAQYNFELSNHKDKLNKQQIILNKIRKEINIKENQIEKLNMDLEYTEHQLGKLERRMTLITKSIEFQETGDLAEIIKVQSELEEMKKTYARLERHGSVQLAALKAIKKRQQLIDQIKSRKTSYK